MPEPLRDAAAKHVPAGPMTSMAATTSARKRWMAAVVASLLVAAAALLILGVVLERHIESGTEHPIVAATGEPQESHHDEATHAEPGVPTHGGGEAAERSTGIDVESPLIVALGGIASAVLALPQRCGCAPADRLSPSWWRSRRRPWFSTSWRSASSSGPTTSAWPPSLP
jgi:hypothetical protein